MTDIAKDRDATIALRLPTDGCAADRRTRSDGKRCANRVSRGSGVGVGYFGSSPNNARHLR